MNSVKCPECNLTNWATAVECKRCKHLFQAAAPDHQPFRDDFSGQPFAADQFSNESEFPSPNQSYRPNYQPQNYRQQNYQNYQPENLKSGLAIASMILGILGFVTSILLIGVLIAPVGLIFGIVALVKANKKPNVYGGKGFAIAGIVLSAMIVLFIPIIAAIAIPNFLAARRAANEGSAITAMRTLSGAEMTFMSVDGSGKCADLQALSSQKLIDPVLGKGERNGYRFTVLNLPVIGGGCEIHAVPQTSSIGTRSFYFSTEDGVIRAADKKGKFADKSDDPLDDHTPGFSTQPSKIATRY
ncbi:MAG: DUF4190 domain-containing protein [Pyrinomonadaceae bacterium]|nr:DUF4190 domain-containing protein [Pyrinomonadaceae bacterium]